VLSEETHLNRQPIRHPGNDRSPWEAMLEETYNPIYGTTH
jgi:hypothetical protein